MQRIASAQRHRIASALRRAHEAHHVVSFRAMSQVDYVEFYNVLIGVTSAQEVIMSMSDEVRSASCTPSRVPSVVRTQ